MPERFVTVAELRAKMAQLLGALDADGTLYVTQRGRPRAGLVDVDRYRALMGQIEYLDDAVEALMARERRENGEAARPLSELVAERRGAKPKRRAAARRVNARVSR